MPPEIISTRPFPAAPAVRERPIPFSAPMVRALLADTKTQTRRAVAFLRTRESFVLEDHGNGWWPFQSDDGESSLCNDGMGHPYTCPYGQPGDRLWVRENGWQRLADRAERGWPYAYDADAPFGISAANEAYREEGWKRPPSIHMPRWASRILLEVTDVRVERLQDISEAEAIAEGAPGGHGAVPCYAYSATPIEHYRHIWNDINGSDAWANPWVWAVSFRRVPPTGGISDSGGSTA